MDRRPQRNNVVRAARGFTLLEVVVAMTLLAFGVTSALAAISACVRNTEAAGSYSRGVLLAQQVAAELERNATLTDGTLTGTFADQSTGADDSQELQQGTTLPNAAYSWTAVVSPIDAQGMYPAEITVTWSGNRQYTLATALRPQAPPPALSGVTP